MANQEHLDILKQGVVTWNKWRQMGPTNTWRPDLSGANLVNADLRRANLSRADLSGANLSGDEIPVIPIDGIYIPDHPYLRGIIFGANLIGADLSDANLIGSILSKANLSDADLSDADLSDADLNGAKLYRANLSRANLSRANLSRADLRRTSLGRANLSRANLSRADLSRGDLSYAICEQADFSGADLKLVRLIHANLNGATLSGAYFWQTQRAGWSINGLVCESMYLDEGRKEVTKFAPGEFERLWADKTKIVLHYPDGISQLEIMTLPLLIKQLETKYKDCVLRFKGIEETAGGASVTLVIDNHDDITPDEVNRLKTELEESGKRLVEYQRIAFSEREGRLQIVGAHRLLRELYDSVLERAMDKPNTTFHINNVGNIGDAKGNVAGSVSGKQIYKENSNLAEIKELVETIIERVATHPNDLSPEQRQALEPSLSSLQTELTTQNPNPSKIKELLRSVRTVLEGTASEVLANNWSDIISVLRGLGLG